VYGVEDKCIEYFDEKLKGNGPPLGRPRHRCVDVKTDLKERG
jgi:hypothetical protein